MHGDDTPNSNTYCNGNYNLCKRSEKNKVSLFIGLKMKKQGNRNWINDFDFSCLYDEAKTAVTKIKPGLNLPSRTILAGFSGGGNALQKIYNNNQQPDVDATIFFDACYGSWCKSVAEKGIDVRGLIYVYAKDTLRGTKDLRKDFPNVRALEVSKRHLYIPKFCFNDHLDSDLCEGQGVEIN